MAALDRAPADSLRRRRSVWALAALLLVSAGLRLAVAEMVAPVKPLGDEMYYVVVASNIAEGRGHVYGENARALRPPAHAWLLSRFVDPDTMGMAPAGQTRARRSVRLDALRPLVRLQVVVGCLLVLATVWLGRELFDLRTGLVAGCFAAVYPTFIAYSHFLWSETLFALLATAALAAWVAASTRRSVGMAVVSGAFFGAAALTREIALPVCLAGVAWSLIAARPDERAAAALRAGLCVGCAVLVISPWVARNYAIFGRILPISSVGWIAIGEGNALEGARWLSPSAPGRSDFRREVLAVEGEAERIDFARKRTLERIAADQPGWVFRKIAHNVPLMLSPDAFQLYKLRNGSYGEVSSALFGGIKAATVFSYGIVMVLAIVGVAASARGRRRLLALLVFAAVLGLHVVANANSRFRMPWMPFLMAYAAFAAVGGRTLVTGLGPVARLCAALAVLLLFGVCGSFAFSS